MSWPRNTKINKAAGDSVKISRKGRAGVAGGGSANLWDERVPVDVANVVVGQPREEIDQMLRDEDEGEEVELTAQIVDTDNLETAGTAH